MWKHLKIKEILRLVIFTYVPICSSYKIWTDPNCPLGFDVIIQMPEKNKRQFPIGMQLEDPIKTTIIFYPR